MAGGSLDPAPGDAFDRWARVTYRGLGYLGGLILAVMTLAVFAQVVMRYMGLAGIDGLDEVPRYLFVWLVMIGAAAAMQRGEHTRLEYFVERWGPGGALVASRQRGGYSGFFCRSSDRVVSCDTQLHSSAGLSLPLGGLAAVPVGALSSCPVLRTSPPRGALWRKPF